MGSKSTKTTQENKPPAWAAPLFKQGASEAQRLYDTKTGYNTYTGPTQAALSAPTLSGMNSALAATGFTGAPISNESINAGIPDVMAIMQQAMAGRQQPQAPANRGGDLIWIDAMGPGREGYYIQRPFDKRTGEYLSDDDAAMQERRNFRNKMLENRGSR
ncbi:hypothetical protein DKP76_11485 [Falsochrobactrum shanghaiense]|uniref:Uncharacterized protein n=1 Tax=Falsochrobactrum shanghaiense TaxID=2201899 RepID=A0A316JE59_9HYPH|nr:hypothetical protein [Falsochrobactrum shanghaiense]PWL17393.1 hypothetical protein DKP76_11485 [Falsochrobactrum shanghaiense]